MSLTPLKDFPQLERAIMRKIFQLVKGRYSDNQWHEFKETLTIGKIEVEFECTFKLNNNIMSFKKKQATHEGRVIIPAHSGLQ